MSAVRIRRSDSLRGRAASALAALLVVAIAAACDGDDEGAASASPLLGGCIADCSAVPAPACFVSQCNGATGQCELIPRDGGECDDGLFCTVHDRCEAGRCTGEPNTCGLQGPTCKSVACEEATRTCRFVEQPDDAACRSDEACSLGGVCNQGICIPEPKTCRFEKTPDECHVATCNPATGACDTFVPGNEGATCGTDPCLVLASCHSGLCIGGLARDCSGWADDCHTAACDTAHGGCYAVPANSGSTCSAGDVCNRGTCDAVGACVLASAGDGTACSDGLACTTNDACSGGRCVGSGGSTAYLRETFASNAQGWTTTGTWMIGRARDTGFPYTPCKPTTDHTGFGDKGVATTGIGGHDGFTVHDFTYLTSPAVDTSSATTVVLQYVSVLGWMPPPMQEAIVEVWNGTTWIRIWEANGGAEDKCRDDDFEPIWQRMEFDVSAHKNAAMRVRFGVASNVVQPNPGWTIDDLALLSAACK